MTKISVTASIVAIALLIGPIHSFAQSAGGGDGAGGAGGSARPESPDPRGPNKNI